MKEEWSEIDGYTGYEISNYGRILSTKGKNPRFLKQRISNNGYNLINLYQDGVSNTYQVQVLVANIFCINDSPEIKTQVNHKNEVKTDNRSCNLEWVTPAQNINHGTANARRAKALGKPVNQYDMEGYFMRTWSSISEAARVGFNAGSISKCCSGKQKSHSGFMWRLKST